MRVVRGDVVAVLVGVVCGVLVGGVGRLAGPADRVEREPAWVCAVRVLGDEGFGLTSGGSAVPQAVVDRVHRECWRLTEATGTYSD
jgi:hypothetical protein